MRRWADIPALLATGVIIALLAWLVSEVKKARASEGLYFFRYTTTMVLPHKKACEDYALFVQFRKKMEAPPECYPYRQKPIIKPDRLNDPTHLKQTRPQKRD